ncbi:MAG: ECF transporter S component [Defluviitaleaceae bacterium]|nr:ECF transporter S component [Defluviitaleaceae bacterium]MCL2275583.1 ECF transporter S component [Defluviitaleaceae bacterium]
MWNLYKWKLKDVILASIISVLFAFICFATVHSVSFVVAPLVMPFGFGDIAIEFVFGIFFMSATLAAYVIQKPGVAVIVGTMTGVVQVLMGSAFAATLLPSAFFQGLGVEAVFFATRYKKFNLPVMLLAAVGPTITSFVLAWYRGLWMDLDFGFVATRFVIRLCSALLFSGIITKLLADRLAKVGVLKSYPLGTKYSQDIDDES